MQLTERQFALPVIRLLLAIIAGTSIGLTGNAQAAAEAEVISYQGNLTNQAVDSILRNLRSHPTVSMLQITSPGGQADAGLRLGRYVHDHDIEVSVLGYCMSACAQYVFLPAARRQLNADGLVVFHSTPSFIRHLLKQTDQLREGPGFDRPSQMEFDFYKEIGIDPLTLNIGLQGLQPVCVGVIKDRPLHDPNRIFATMIYPGYVLSEQALRKLGVRGSLGAWPASLQEVRERLRHLPFSSRMILNYVASFDRQWIKTHRRVSQCRG